MLKPTPCSRRSRSINSGSSLFTARRRRLTHALSANFGSSRPAASAPITTMILDNPVASLMASAIPSTSTASSSRRPR
ncbi:hypothetical protein D3C73_1243990 [compost metagenome]